jgi:KDEL-tailed cysteine endopeptidase
MRNLLYTITSTFALTSYKDATECELCVHGLDYLEQELIGKVSPEQIQDTVAELCSMFKKPSQNTYCKNLVGEVINDGLNYFKQYGAYVICQELSVCPAKTLTKKQKQEKIHLNEFVKFKKQFKKSYKDLEEYMKRHRIFRENFDYIQNHNKNNKNSLVLGINYLVDLTQDEFKSKYTNKMIGRNLDSTFECKHQDEIDKGLLTGYRIPRRVNWVEAGVVNPAKNQQQCGSCYVFSALSVIESATALSTGELPNLSEEDVVDNCKRSGCMGCHGGLMPEVFLYAKKNGICRTRQCPYNGIEDDSCEHDTCEDKVYVDECVMVKQLDQQALIKAVARQPVSIAVQADRKEFQFYKSGILNTTACSPQYELDHGVVIDTYDLDEGYFGVRNSWSSDWGTEIIPGYGGYIKLAIREDIPQGICGLAMMPSYATVSPDTLINI